MKNREKQPYRRTNREKQPNIIIKRRRSAINQKNKKEEINQKNQKGNKCNQSEISKGRSAIN